MGEVANRRDGEMANGRMGKDANEQPRNLADSPSQNIVSAARGGGVIFFGRMFEYAGRFALGILMGRFMGAGQYGVYSLADTTLSIIIGISFLGLSAGVVHFIPMFKNRRDDDSLWGTIIIGLGIPFLVGIGAAIALLGFSNQIIDLLHKPNLLPLLPVVALATPVSILMYAAVQATQGFKKMRYKVIAMDIVLTALKLLLTIPLVFVGLDAFRAMTVHTIGTVFACGLILYFLNQLFPLHRSIKSARFNVKQIFAFSLPLYFSQLIAMFGGQIEIIFLGALSTAASVGIFTVASRVSMIGKMFHSSVVTVAMPYVSELYDQHDWKQLGHFYQTVTKWTFAFNLPMFLIVLLFPKPILSVFGDSFISGANTLIILALSSLVGAATGICGVVITMTERTWLNTFNSILDLGSTILLNMWLVPEMGVTGAALAELISVTLVNAVRLIEVYAIFRLSPYNRTFFKPITAGLVALSATYILYYLIFAEIGIMGVIINIIFLLAVYMATIISLGLADDDRLILDKVIGRLKRIRPG